MNVSYRVLAPTDYAQYESFGIRFATPARDQEIRELIYQEAAGHLLSRGLEQDQEQPDFYVVIHPHQVGNSVLGMMRVEIVDGPSDTPVWIAQGSETLALDKPGKMKRQLKKLISEIFKHFPVGGR